MYNLYRSEAGDENCFQFSITSTRGSGSATVGPVNTDYYIYISLFFATDHKSINTAMTTTSKSDCDLSVYVNVTKYYSILYINPVII